MTANPAVIQMFSARTKCWQCKHRFARPVLLPVKEPKRGKFQPNINSEVLWHVQETHGIDPGITYEWVVGTIYGQELTLFGVKVGDAK